MCNRPVAGTEEEEKEKGKNLLARPLFRPPCFSFLSTFYCLFFYFLRPMAAGADFAVTNDDRGHKDAAAKRSDVEVGQLFGVARP